MATITLRPDGMNAFYVGFVWNGSKRVQKRFTSKVETLASRLATALEIPWGNETETDPSGKKVWNQSNMDMAMAMVVGARPETVLISAADPKPFVSVPGED